VPRLKGHGSIQFLQNGDRLVAGLSPLDDSRGSEKLLRYGDFTEPRQ